MGDHTSPTPASPSHGDARPQPMSADLTAEDVCEFVNLCEKEYGVRLTDDEAKERAEKLVRFVLLMQRMGS
jgi:hypothetical protein